jgi:hypothetical protein
MLMRVATVGMFFVLIICGVGNAQGPVGCCACAGFHGMPDASGCSSDSTGCANPSAETSCIDTGGTFMPFTIGLVCVGDVMHGHCVALRSPAPTLSPRAILFVAVALALIGYRGILRRRGAR